MSDVISRQDAIRWVRTESNPYGKPTLDYGSGLKVIEHLKKMRSAFPLPLADRPNGEWIIHSLIDEGRVELECPECENTFVRSVGYRPHFCEYCGADMRGDKE